MKIDSSFLDLIRHGGFMMIPLLLSALIALTVIIERFTLFKKRFETSPELLKNLRNALTKGDLSEAKKMVAHENTPLTEVLKVGLQNANLPEAIIEKMMSNEAERWIPELEKRVEILDTVITAAPLMGLLGTITGMMSSFQILSKAGVNEPNAITGGVGEALIATATGLVIALFCLLAYNYFNSKIKNTLSTIEAFANHFLESILKRESASK